MVAFLLLFYLMNTPQVKSVQPQPLIQSVYSSTHRLLLPNLTMGHMHLIWEWEKGWLISKNYTPVTSSLRHIFTTSSFTKKAAISKGIWSTCKGFVSFFLLFYFWQITNEGSRGTRNVQWWMTKSYAVPRSVCYSHTRHTEVVIFIVISYRALNIFNSVFNDFAFNFYCQNL